MFAIKNKKGKWWSNIRNRWVDKEVRQNFYDVSYLPDFIDGNPIRTYTTDFGKLQYVEVETGTITAEVMEVRGE